MVKAPFRERRLKTQATPGKPFFGHWGLTAKRREGLVTEGQLNFPTSQADPSFPLWPVGEGEGGEDAGSGLTPVGVGALGGDRGADAVHPYPLDAQLLQLPLQVPLLSLKLVYLVNGFPVTIFKFLQVKGVVRAHRQISKLAMTLHLPL